jgi:hypothetical protein
MNDPVANGQLELACRLSSLDDIVEALDDGADINCKGYSPLFIAIQNADRAVLKVLVERGADVSVFEIDAEGDDPVEQLMKMAPDQETQSDTELESEGMAELDAKMIRAFQRMIINKGIAEPLAKGRGDEFEAFADGLRSIAAEECHAIVREFLDREKPEDTDGTNDTETLAALSERYAKATEEEQPGELLKDYLKESKKVK